MTFRAWALLPDHLHWLLEPLGADFSKVVFSFKRGVSAEEKHRGRHRTGEQFWQDRFWEHTVRNEEDFRHCVEYIHYNPVKHGRANSPHEWPYSSFAGFVKEGLYRQDWGDGRELVVPGAEWDV